MKQLKVGDVIYVRSFGQFLTRRFLIERLTKKYYAFGDNCLFKINYDEKNNRLIFKDGSPSNCYVENDTLKEEWKKVEIINKIKVVNLYDFSFERLQEIYNVIFRP